MSFIVKRASVNIDDVGVRGIQKLLFYFGFYVEEFVCDIMMAVSCGDMVVDLNVLQLHEVKVLPPLSLNHLIVFAVLHLFLRIISHFQTKSNWNYLLSLVIRITV